MTRTTIILISLLACFQVCAQDAPTHVGAIGAGVTNYKNLDTPIRSTNINVASDWAEGFSSDATFQIKTMGNELAFCLNAGLRKTLNEKTTLNSVTTLSTGDWQPNLAQQIGIARKHSDTFESNASATVYLGQNRKPIFVASAGLLKSFGQSTVSLKAFNQISEVGALNPTLAASYIYASKNENIIAIFAQTGYQTALDNLLGAGTASLRQVGGGLWFKLNLNQNYYVLGSMGINSFSSTDANFASQSFKLSFHIK